MMDLPQTEPAACLALFPGESLGTRLYTACSQKQNFMPSLMLWSMTVGYVKYLCRSVLLAQTHKASRLLFKTALKLKQYAIISQIITTICQYIGYTPRLRNVTLLLRVQ